MPDPSLLLSQPPAELLGPDPTLLDFGSSQRSLRNLGRTRAISIEAPRLEEDIGLELDFGEDVPMGGLGAREIEVGRDAPPERAFGEDLDDTMKMYEGDDLALDLGGDEELPARRESSILPGLAAIGRDDDLDMAIPDLEDDFILPPLNDIDVSRNQRRSESPLSSVRSSVERELEQSIFRQEPTIVMQDDEEPAVVQHQRIKRRKILQADTDTEMRSAQIKSQQEDRSKILKPLSLLPRDPALLALMNMQRNGEFVSNILGDGRSQGWAPQLRGILSLEVIRRTGELKRKRDSGLADIAEEPSEQEGLGLVIDPEESTILPGQGFDLTANTTVHEEPILQLPSDGLAVPLDDTIPPAQAATPDAGDFGVALGAQDEPSTLPAHDIISLGTKHAVHLLRERFEADTTPSRRKTASVLFQDLLPERTTTRADASTLR